MKEAQVTNKTEKCLVFCAMNKLNESMHVYERQYHRDRIFVAAELELIFYRFSINWRMHIARYKSGFYIVCCKV